MVIAASANNNAQATIRNTVLHEIDICEAPEGQKASELIDAQGAVIS
jgi:hypothetical protein